MGLFLVLRESWPGIFPVTPARIFTLTKYAAAAGSCSAASGHGFCFWPWPALERENTNRAKGRKCFRPKWFLHVWISGVSIGWGKISVTSSTFKMEESGKFKDSVWRIFNPEIRWSSAAGDFFEDLPSGLNDKPNLSTHTTHRWYCGQIGGKWSQPCWSVKGCGVVTSSNKAFNNSLGICIVCGIGTTGSTGTSTSSVSNRGGARGVGNTIGEVVPRDCGEISSKAASEPGKPSIATDWELRSCTIRLMASNWSRELLAKWNWQPVQLLKPKEKRAQRCFTCGCESGSK